MSSQVTCGGCQQSLAAAEFLNACLWWDENLECVQFRCPGCARLSEARLETGCLTHGYIGAAGGAYFAGMEPVPLPTLVVERCADGLKITLDEASRTLTRP